jgi:hypothetical protein
MIKKAPMLVLVTFMVFVLSACTNSIANYFTNQTAVMETATSTLWTPTPTITLTNTSTITQTNTPTNMPSQTPVPRNFEKSFSYVPPEGWVKSSRRFGGEDVQTWTLIGPAYFMLAFDIIEGCCNVPSNLAHGLFTQMSSIYGERVKLEGEGQLITEATGPESKWLDAY